MIANSYRIVFGYVSETTGFEIRIAQTCVQTKPLPLPLPSSSAFVLGQCDLLAVQLFLSTNSLLSLRLRLWYFYRVKSTTYRTSTTQSS